MKKLILILSLSSLVFGALRADTSDINRLERKIEAALYRADTTMLDEADAELARALAAEPKSPALLYLRGLSTYARTRPLYAKRDQDGVRKVLEAALEQLKAVKGQPWECEAQALRGLLMGELIAARGAMSGMTLGPKMSELTADALEQMPASGRVLCFRGVALLHMPEMFGGDVPEAKRLFQRADAAFKRDAERANPDSKPTWGHAETLKWLAQANLKMNDLEAAKLAVERALELEPDFQLVRYQLLPAILKKRVSKH
jgi:tetratricopeptide (TPR) repeat protein